MTKSNQLSNKNSYISDHSPTPLKNCSFHSPPIPIDNFFQVLQLNTMESSLCFCLPHTSSADPVNLTFTVSRTWSLITSFILRRSQPPWSLARHSDSLLALECTLDRWARWWLLPPLPRQSRLCSILGDFLYQLKLKPEPPTVGLCSPASSASTFLTTSPSPLALALLSPALQAPLLFFQHSRHAPSSRPLYLSPFHLECSFLTCH